MTGAVARANKIRKTIANIVLISTSPLQLYSLSVFQRVSLLRTCEALRLAVTRKMNAPGMITCVTTNFIDVLVSIDGSNQFIHAL